MFEMFFVVMESNEIRGNDFLSFKPDKAESTTLRILNLAQCTTVKVLKLRSCR